MIKAAYKYYLKFPPVIRQAVDFSISGMFGYAGVDYSPTSENILLGANDFSKKLFV